MNEDIPGAIILYLTLRPHVEEKAFPSPSLGRQPEPEVGLCKLCFGNKRSSLAQGIVLEVSWNISEQLEPS